MKHKRRTLIKKLLISTCIFTVSLIIEFTAIHFHWFDDNSNESLAAFFYLAVLIGTTGVFIYQIVTIIKYFTDKATKNKDELHNDPKPVVYKRIDQNYGSHSDTVSDQDQQKYYIYNNSTEDKNLAWWAIITLIIILPPMGIYYLIKKILLEPAFYFKNGKKLLTFGIVICVLSSFIFLFPIMEYRLSGGMSDSVAKLSLLPSFILFFGIVLAISGFCIRQTGFTNDNLINIITTEKVSNIDSIAQKTKLKKSDVYFKVNTLIKSGRLPEAYISPEDNEIILPGISKKVAIRCKNCTGTTVLFINNPNRICSYCGGKL